MKYLYNGKVIRNSKIQDYNFAAITSEYKCICCSATREGCARGVDIYTANGRSWLRNYEEIYNGTFKETINGWTAKDIMLWFNNSKEELKAEIDKEKAYYNGIKIVELEKIE